MLTLNRLWNLNYQSFLLTLKRMSLSWLTVCCSVYKQLEYSGVMNGYNLILNVQGFPPQDCVQMDKTSQQSRRCLVQQMCGCWKVYHMWIVSLCPIDDSEAITSHASAHWCRQSWDTREARAAECVCVYMQASHWCNIQQQSDRCLWLTRDNNWRRGEERSPATVLLP